VSERGGKWLKADIGGIERQQYEVLALINHPVPTTNQGVAFLSVLDWKAGRIS
jgi:hypothetical protein